MTKNIDQKEGSKFRTVKNDGLGASRIKYLKIGDLVEWDCWEYNLEDEVFATQNGLLVDIVKDKRVSGWVYLAKIVPFGADMPIEIPIISVRKMTEAD